MIPPVRLSAALALIGAAAVLSGALLLQYRFGVEPCHLCLVQRHPYHAAIPLLALALWPAMPDRASRVLTALAALAFAASTLLAAYHSGVELGLLPAPDSCAAASLPGPSSVEAFAASLRGARVVPCDAVSFRLLGLSLANWNLLASPALLAACLAWALPAGRRALARLPVAR